MKQTIIALMLLCFGISLAFAQITTFPWTEDFEGTFLPDGWTKIVQAGNDITQSNSQNHTDGGTYSARFSSYSSSTDYNQYLFSPAVTVNAAYAQLSFWHRKYNQSAESLEWGISTSTDPLTFTWTAVNLSNTAWQQTIVDLSSYAGSTVYLGFHYYGNYAYYVYLDDVDIDAAPSVPEFSIDPLTWNFVDVEVGTTASQTFIVSNEGGGDLGIVSIQKTAGDVDYFEITNITYTDPLGLGEDFSFDVEFTPAAAAAYTVTITITDDQTKATHDVVITGNGYTRPAGSTCDNPYPVTLPLVGFMGDTSLYGDDYESGWVTPTSYYLGGDDLVLQFTLTEESSLEGTLTAVTGNYIGMYVLASCPDVNNPPTVLASAVSGSGTVANMSSGYLSAGTYFLIIGTWPSPQSAEFTLDLEAIPAPTEPAFSIDLTGWDFGTVQVGTPVGQTFTITNTGGGTLFIDLDDIDIDPATPQFVPTLPAEDISLGNGDTAEIVVTFTPTEEIAYAADILILDNITGGKAKAERRVPLTGQGFDATIDDFPSLEGFEAGVIPTGWGLTAGAGASRNWEVVTTDSDHGADAPYSGEYFARLYVYLASTSYNPYCLVSPPVDLSSGNVVLSYYAWLGANGSATPLAVEISTDGMATWQPLYSHDLSISNTWFNNEIPLANFSSPMAYIRFVGTSNYGYGDCDMGLDEIILYEETNVPVELSSFTATITAENDVQLSWKTQSESQMVGYRVYRGTADEQSGATLIDHPLIPATNTSTTQDYTVVDNDVVIGTTYYYWLEAVDYASSAFHGPVSVTVNGNVPPVLPEVTSMRNAYPNPFRASANIEVGIKAGETGSLTIYNVAGQVVKSFQAGEGVHNLSWDGRDSTGKACGSGIYFYQLNTPSFNQTRKMMYLK